MRPEEFERMKNDAISKLASQPTEDSDADRFMRNFIETVGRVKAQVQPIGQAAIDNGSIHTTEGRRAFHTTTTKLFLDAFVHMSLTRDEALFVLAIIHSEILLDELA